MNKTLLLADIGGTNINLAIAKQKNQKYIITNQKIYQTNMQASFTKLIKYFLNEHKLNITTAVLGIATKITNQEIINLTNSDLEININELKENTTLETIHTINDFTALAYSVEKLKKTQLKIIQPVINKAINPTNDKLVIGAGTGLGISRIFYKYPFKEEYKIIPTERGHDNLVISDIHLFQFLQKNLNKKTIEIEDILSGHGLELLYQYYEMLISWYDGSKNSLSNKKTAKEIGESKHEDACSQSSLELFFKFYAETIRKFCLEFETFGGVYIAGGIIQKNLDFNHKDFKIHFIGDDIFSNMLKKVPIHIIKDYNASLIGLVNYYEKHYKSQNL